MQAKDAIKNALSSTQHMVQWYLADLSDEDLLVKPVPNANNIAWQLAHLVEAEGMLIGTLPGYEAPNLPANVKAGKDGSAPAGGFPKKDELLELFNRVRNSTTTAVDKLSDADFDKPTTGDMAKWAPNLGALLMLTATHTMMHAGQFTVVRRKLNKPVLF